MKFAAVLELELNAETLDQARIVLHRALEETRAFDGNLGVEVLVDHEDPARWLILESWRSAECDARYLSHVSGRSRRYHRSGATLAAPLRLTTGNVDPQV